MGLLGGWAKTKATAKTTALSVERYERFRWYGLCRGPSTAQPAKCASCLAQDDGVLGGLEGWQSGRSGDGFFKGSFFRWR
jgi:hypothetical protein